MLLIVHADCARATYRQRLVAKTRQKGAVLIATTHWAGADVELEMAAETGSWRGLVGDGHGRLSAAGAAWSTGAVEPRC